MKFAVAAFAAITVALASASAQTNTPAPAPAPATNAAVAAPATNLLQEIGLTSLGAGWSAFSAGFVDVEPYISNKIVSIDTGLLYNKSDKQGKFGGYIAASIPLTAQSEFCLGGFYLNKNIGNMEGSITLGTTVSNFLGVGALLGPVYAWSAAGTDYNFAKDPATHSAYGVGSYTAAGVEKKFTLSKTWTFTPGFGVFNVSTIPGVGEMFNLKFTKRF